MKAWAGPPIEAIEPRVLLWAAGDTFVAPASPRVAVNENAGWAFTLTPGSSPQNPATDTSGWSSVTLPHTWNGTDAQNGGLDYKRGVGWYRKTITAPAETVDGVNVLHFDGASIVSRVYVDGTLLAQHNGTFGGFDVDVTNALADGQPHVLAVAVDNSASISATVAPTSAAGFNIYGGLYRSVTLNGMEATHVSTHKNGSSGVFFSTPNVSPDGSQATIAVLADIDNAADLATDVLVDSVLVDQNGVVAAAAQTGTILAADGTTELAQSAAVQNPHLWNGVLDPYLYTLYTTVTDSATGAVLDSTSQQVGIRTYRISATQGFFLNGQSYDLHGVNYHQEAAGKGWALSDADTQTDINTMREMGVTVVRSHYQLSPYFYQAADRAGLVVMTEVPLNGSYDRNMALPAAVVTSLQQQMAEMVKQNYNHPSIISWGVYNELTDNAVDNAAIASIGAIAHQLDATRFTVGSSWDKTFGTLEKQTDTVAFNLYYGWYQTPLGGAGAVIDSLHAAAPTTAIGISEYGAGGQLNQHDNFAGVQPNGFWHPEDYQSLFHEKTWPALAARPFLWVKIAWQMFDSFDDRRTDGGVLGINDKGLVTTNHQTRKDAFYYYKSVWTTTPTLRLTDSRYTTRDTAQTEIKVYSNLGSVDLFLNGNDLGAMTQTAPGVWTMASVTLAKGANVVTVTGTQGDQTYTDSATWTCTATPTGPATGSLAGFIFGDANANGIYDAGDSVAGDRVVFLDANNNGTLDVNETKTTSAADGTWSFKNLAAGTYHVRRVFPTGYTQSTANIDPTLTAGQAVTGLAIGSKSITATTPTTATLSGYAFSDANANGVFDGTDKKLAGQTVFLDLDGDNVLDANETKTTTASDGSWSFKNLAAGSYHVRGVFASGASLSTAVVDVSPTAGQTISGLTIGSKSATTPPPATGTASLAGSVFNDNNSNAKYDTGDGVGKSVTVFLDADDDGILDAGEVSVVTDTNGKFAFKNLNAGTYHVRRVLTAGLTYSTPKIDVTLTTGQAKTGLLIGTKK